MGRISNSSLQQLTKYTAICRNHWPQNRNFNRVYEKLRPVDPPSIFTDVPTSCLVTTPAQERTTIIACSSARNTLPDELEKIEKQLIVKFSEIAKDIQVDDLISYEQRDEVFFHFKTLYLVFRSLW